MKRENRFIYRTILSAAVLGLASSIAIASENFFPGDDPDLSYFAKAFPSTTSGAPMAIELDDYDLAALPSEDPNLGTFNDLFRDEGMYSGKGVGSGLTCSDDPTLEYWSRYVPPV